jgi:hypothetical protein
VSEGLIVRPGDVLIVGVQGGYSAPQLDAMGQSIKRNLPGLANVLLLGGVQGMAVYRAEPEPKPPPPMFEPMELQRWTGGKIE